MVLAGGGARGAYEAGVVAELLACGFAPGVVCGTSIGAVHAAFVAGAVHDPRSAADRLERAWCSLELDDVLPLRLASVGRLARVATGGMPAGLFRSEPLVGAVSALVDFGRVAENIAAGRVRAATVTCTRVTTGAPVVFVHRHPDVPLPTHIGRGVEVRGTRLAPHHVLASSALPLLFAPVDVDGELYCDGGLRMNTPLGPAVRLGADRVLVVSVSSAREQAREPQLAAGRSPGAAFLMGKVLDAFLLDQLSGDLDELGRINQFLADGAAACPEFADRLGEVARDRGAPKYHTVRPAVIRPSVDLAGLAGDRVRELRLRPRSGNALRLLLRIVDRAEGAASDLASWLLFDGVYARQLFELGRTDVRADAATLAALFDRGTSASGRSRGATVAPRTP
jgi:NTE family protein